MRTIREGARFRRDLKRESRGPYRTALLSSFEAIVGSLARDETLAPSLRDHQMAGNLASCRNCHIKPDLVLLYRKLEPQILELVRLGTHSELDL